MNNRYISEKCFVLKRQLHKENDARLILYGAEMGKFFVIARGLEKATSKLSALLDCGNYVEITFVEGKNANIMTSCTQIDGFIKRFEGHEALLTSAYLCDLLDATTENGMAQKEVFALFEKMQTSLDDHCYREVRLYFEWHYLALLGYSDATLRTLETTLANVWKSECFSPKQQAVLDEAWSYFSCNNIYLCALSKGCAETLERALEKIYQQQLDIKLHSQKILDDVVYNSASRTLDNRKN